MTATRLLTAAIALLVVSACGGSASTAGPSAASAAPGSSAAPTSAPAASGPQTGPTPVSIPTPVRTAIPSSATAASPPPAATPAVPTAASQESAAAIDVCGLFTGDELATLTGHTLLSTTPGPQSVDPYGCEWDFETPDVGINWSISVGVWPNVPRADFESGKAYAIGTPVPGVGDDAYLVGSNSVTALSGDTEIDVQYVNLSDDPGIDQVPITVAEEVVQRLPH